MKRPTIGSAMLTTSDAAYLLCAHVNTVRRWSNKRILKAYHIGPRGDRRFRRDDIAQFLIEQYKREGI